MKPKYREKAKLCYMDTDTFILYIKTENFYVNVSKDIERRFDTSSYELQRPLPKGENKKIIGLITDKLGSKQVEVFVTMKPKTYSYLTGYNNENKKYKVHKYGVIKRKIKFEDQKYCLEALQVEKKVNELIQNKVDVDSLHENHREFIRTKN